MIDLRVTGHETPEQSREEIARLLKEYCVGAVCLLRNGRIGSVLRAHPSGKFDLGGEFQGFHQPDGEYEITGDEDEDADIDKDIIRVYPPGTSLRVTVEVVE